MCGRYRRTSSEEELTKRYHIPIPIQSDLPISWNIAPSQPVLTIRRNPETGERSLDALKWGLIPSWSKDGKVQYSTINARAETVDTSAVCRGAFKKRRCLIPADSFSRYGSNGLTDVEHLTLLVGKESAARGLMEHFGSLQQLSRASLAELQQFVSKAKAATLLAPLSVSTRVHCGEGFQESFDQPETVY
jgi:hypothetical protein